MKMDCVDAGHYDTLYNVFKVGLCGARSKKHVASALCSRRLNMTRKNIRALVTDAVASDARWIGERERS